MTRKRCKKIAMSLGVKRNTAEKVLSRKPVNTPNILALSAIAFERLADILLDAERVTGKTLAQLAVEADNFANISASEVEQDG